VSTDWFSLAAAGQSALEAAGFAAGDARRDAVLLARSVLGWDAARWLTDARHAADADLAARFQLLIDRRRRHEPVAYLIGERSSTDDPPVAPGVLTPGRAELIVDKPFAPPLGPVAPGPWASRRTSARVRDAPGDHPFWVPSARVVAIDLSEAALAVAAENAERLGAADRVSLSTPRCSPRRSRPIRPDRREPPQRRQHRPVGAAQRWSVPARRSSAATVALTSSGPLVPQAAGAWPGGWLVMEIGQGQINDVEDLIAGMHGLAFHHVRADLQGILRVVVARAPGEA
jgi:release factor glutamine methyltransferase